MKNFKKRMKCLSLFLSFNLGSGLFLRAHVDLKDGIECANTMRAAVFEKVFDNGFTLLFFEKQEAPQVFLQLCFNVGSGDEHSEKTYGYAHLLEHMAFKGTTDEGLNLSETDIDTLAQKCNLSPLGIGFNAFTSYDSTSYFFSADQTNWSVFIKVLADMMQHLRVAPEHIASEMKAVYQEMKARNSDGAGDIFGELLPGNHPYHHPIIGFKENVLTADAADVRAFYRKHYRPDKAALIVVGNVDKDQLIAHVEEYFVPMNRFSQPTEEMVKKDERESFSKAPLYADFSQKNSLIYNTTARTEVRHCWIIPGTCNSVDDAKASVIEFVLNNRLKHLLFDQHKMVFTLYVSKTPCLLHNYFYVHYVPHDAGMVTAPDGVTTSLQGDALIEYCKSTVEEELRKIISEGITEDEFDRYKKCSMSSFLGAFEQCSGVAYALQSSFISREPATERFRFFEIIDVLSNKDVQEYARLYLRPFLMNTIITKPIPHEEEQNWTDLRSKIDTYDAQLLGLSERRTDIEKPRFSLTVGPIEPLPFTANPPDETVELSNGMTVYLKKNSAVPFINIFCGFKDCEALSLAYHARKKPDIPHFAMELLWEASEGSTKKEHQEFFDRHGAYCSVDASGISLRCLRSDLAIISKRAFHILTKPTYPAEILQRDTTNLIELIKVGAKMPYATAFKLLQRSLFAEYPWVLQSDDEHIALIHSYTRDDCSQFHQEQVNADRMFIVVVGDFQNDLLMESLEATFGTLPRRAGEIEKVTVPDIVNRESAVLRAFLPEDQVVIGAARVTTYADEKDMLALKILENYTNNLLFDIRQRTGVFYGLGCGLTTGASVRMKGFCYFLTQVTKESVDFAETVIKQVLTELAHTGISQDALNHAKDSYQNMLACSWTTQSSLVSLYADLKIRGCSFDYYQEKLERIKALTLDEVNEVARRYLDPATWTFVQVGRVDPT